MVCQWLPECFWAEWLLLHFPAAYDIIAAGAARYTAARGRTRPWKEGGITVGYDRVLLKRDVKQAMRETRPRPMLVALLFGVIVSVGTGLINGILGRLLTGGMDSYSDLFLGYVQRGYEIDEAVEQAVLQLMSRGPGAMFAVVTGSMVVSILVSLWQGTMNVGYEGYALAMVRRENPETGRIFCAFPRIGGVLVTRVLVGVFSTLWMLLLVVGYVAVAFAVTALAVAIDSEALMILFLILGMVALWLGIVWVTMRYALTDYALLDQDLSGMDAIRESKRLMKGNIGKGFLLRLSFLGWYLLLLLMVYIGAFVFIMAIGMQLTLGGADNLGGLIASAGIGLAVLLAAVIGACVLMLWLRPYETGAMAGFYGWAKGSADGPGGAQGGWGQPASPRQNYDYTWGTGPTSGTGTGSAPGNSSPKPPKRKDDPWD